MKIDLNDLKAHVATLSDEALLEVDRDGLTETAREIYEAEAAERGLTWPGEIDTAALGEGIGAPLATDAPLSEGLVSIAKFESLEEARFARTMLENEGIPVWFLGEVVNDLAKDDPSGSLELLTKEEFAEQAVAALSTEISDEELAKQAAAAGPVPEDADPQD